MKDLKITPVRDYEWLTRLRPGHFVWDVKGSKMTQVVFAYEPPDPGTIVGAIGIQSVHPDGDSYRLGHLKRWFINQDGTGFDGSQLLMPLEDNCPDTPPPLPSVWQRRTSREIDLLKTQVDSLFEQLQISKKLFQMLGSAVDDIKERQYDIVKVAETLLEGCTSP